VESGLYGDDREGCAGTGEVGVALGSGVVGRLDRSSKSPPLTHSIGKGHVGSERYRTTWLWGFETCGFGSSVEEQCLDLLEIDDLPLLD
jgi:hypothetical protein